MQEPLSTRARGAGECGEVLRGRANGENVNCAVKFGLFVVGFPMRHFEVSMTHLKICMMSDVEIQASASNIIESYCI